MELASVDSITEHSAEGGKNSKIEECQMVVDHSRNPCRLPLTQLTQTKSFDVGAKVLVTIRIFFLGPRDKNRFGTNTSAIQEFVQHQAVLAVCFFVERADMIRQLASLGATVRYTR